MPITLGNARKGPTISDLLEDPHWDDDTSQARDALRHGPVLGGRSDWKPWYQEIEGIARLGGSGTTLILKGPHNSSRLPVPPYRSLLLSGALQRESRMRRRRSMTSVYSNTGSSWSSSTASTPSTKTATASTASSTPSSSPSTLRPRTR